MGNKIMPEKKSLMTFDYVIVCVKLGRIKMVKSEEMYRNMEDARRAGTRESERLVSPLLLIVQQNYRGQTVIVETYVLQKEDYDSDSY